MQTQRGDLLAPAAVDEPIVCPVLLGRDRQHKALRDIAAEAAGGHGQTVLLSGEAGIGKSRLSSELAALLEADGWRVLRGSCFERDRTVPYAPTAGAAPVYGPIARQLIARSPHPLAMHPYRPIVVFLTCAVHGIS